jgi:hypothetical protein
MNKRTVRNSILPCTSLLVVLSILAVPSPASSDPPKRMSGREINLLVSESRITPQINQLRAVPVWRESFRADHRWWGGFQDFVGTQIYGDWKTKRDFLCVVPDGGQEDCREVWKDVQSGDVLIKTPSVFKKDVGPFTVNVVKLLRPFRDNRVTEDGVDH